MLAVIGNFNSSNTNQVPLTARGHAITIAVDGAEIVNNRFMKELGIGEIPSRTEEVQQEDGTRNVLTIEKSSKHDRGENMGKRKIKNEDKLKVAKLPVANDVIGAATKMLGNDRLLVSCQDGKERLCRIRGKMKRRMWIRQGDIVLVSPWEFQSDKRGDIIWRYRRNQLEWLRSNGYLKL